MSELEVIPYSPSDIEIDDVTFQVPDSISREDIIKTLIDKNGDMTETILSILTNDNIVPRQDSPKRLNPKEEIKKWTNFYKDMDKYNIQNNIERVKTAHTSAPTLMPTIQ